jgi:cytidine deaminase
MSEAALDPEDQKMLTLARSARSRAYAPYTGTTQGASVRDTAGRTYAAATVEHAEKPLTISAIHAAVATAVASGAREFEVVAVVGEQWTRSPTVDGAVLMEFGADTVVLLASDDGTLIRRTTAAELAGIL